jgi:hypothetical protein
VERSRLLQRKKHIAFSELSDAELGTSLNVILLQ